MAAKRIENSLSPISIFASDSEMKTILGQFDAFVASSMHRRKAPVGFKENNLGDVLFLDS